MAHKVLLITALSLIGLVSETGAVAGEYHATVVDAATGQPISDAVIVVVWYKKARFAFPAGDAPIHFYAAKETLSDGSGRFAMSSSRKIHWNPLTRVEVPQIVIYRPGYEPFSPRDAFRRGFASFQEVEKALRQGASIRLRKLREPECKQAGIVTGLTSLGIILDIPDSDIPNLTRLIREQRARCGMQTS